MSEKKYYTESQILDVLTMSVRDHDLYNLLTKRVEALTPAELPTKVIAHVGMNKDQLSELCGVLSEAIKNATACCDTCAYHGAQLGVLNCFGCKHIMPSHYKAKE